MADLTNIRLVYLAAGVVVLAAAGVAAVMFRGVGRPEPTVAVTA
jgi:ABC-type transporter Mla subunit MlaD